MHKHSTHIIDDQAVHIFKGALPPQDWTIYDLQPDYGKDHKVELVEGGQHTGLSFWVQVKGQKKVRRLKDGTISFKLETKYLDYHTRLPAPIFLVVVDVTNRVGYWVFTQEYERTRLRNVAWRSQDYIQIRLPATNRLSDTRALRAAVKRAIGFMARLSLNVGIDHATDSLRRLDPRFSVRVTATAQGEIVEASPLEDLRVDLRFSADFCKSGKLDHLLGRGLPVCIGPGDVVAEGSLLVGSMLDDTADRNGFLHLCLNGVGHVRLTYLDPEVRENGRSHELECHFEGGFEEVRYLARTTYATLALSGVCSSTPNAPFRIDIAYDLSGWLGSTLSTLPNFDLMNDILGNVEEGGRMRVEFFADATLIFSGYLSWNRVEMESFRCLLGLVELVGKARWIARKFGVDATLPRQITSEHAQEIMKIYRLAQGEQIGLKGAVQSASARLTKINMQTLSKVIGLDGEPFRLALISDGPQPFLGLEVPLGPVKTELSHMRLAEDRETLTRLIREGTTPIPLTWEPTAETEFIIERATEELLSSYEAGAEAQGTWNGNRRTGLTEAM